MSRLEVHLISKTLRATGDILVRAELALLLRDKNNILKPATFRQDSGAEITTMPAAIAKQLDLPMPKASIPGLQHAPTGLEVRSGFIRAQIVGMDGTEHVFPCFFVGNPDALPSLPHMLPATRNLLGLTGVIDKIRISLDGTPLPIAPYGYLILEKK